jgi:RNA-directed DNA polymerase
MVKVHGALRRLLDRLNYLLQKIPLPEYVHGGVPGKSTRTNAKTHTHKDMLVKTDIKNHFPTVFPERVYRMFQNEQQCTPDVAHILTRLTTLNGGLPQGSPTSTTVSNLVTRDLSTRLHHFASVRGYECTQYVDNYDFSGKKQLARCIDKIVQIMKQEGFKVNLSKTEAVPASKEQIVAGVRVNDWQLDIPKSYVRKVSRELADLKQKLENTRAPSFSGKDIRKLECKINYVRQLNRGAGKFLAKQLNRIRQELHPPMN